MKSNKSLIRRTFLQERFDILIKKQRDGRANFNDLTELDEIVNRDPAIRESILEEMQAVNHPPQGPGQKEIITTEPVKPTGLLKKFKAFIHRLFLIEMPGLRAILLN